MITTSEVLRLIRDGHIRSLINDDIWNVAADRTGDKQCRRNPSGSFGPAEQLMAEIEVKIHRLIEANIVTSHKSKLAVNPIVSELQKHLRLSLSELDQLQSTGMVVTPLLGKPAAPTPITDVFVLMPFAVEMLPVYEDHIKPACNRSGVSVIRADDVFGATEVMADVWAQIVHSQVLIADCTGRNPNVFYEIGLAHAAGKPTIMITQSLDDVPFDLRHRRILQYDFTPRGMASFDDMLTKTLDAELEKLQLTGSRSSTDSVSM